MKSDAIEYLIDAFKVLPGVGKKQAEKIAYFLALKNQDWINEFTNRIILHCKNIHFCKQCNNFSDGELCDICLNIARDHNKLCVITSTDDLEKIENTNSYTGMYYVLNGEIDVKNKTNLSHEVIKKFMNLLNHNKYQEILIATNWTINGEATAVFIKKIINELSTASVYRLALGLPINSALDYADNITLKYALQNKTKY